MLVGVLTDARFAAVFAAVERLIEDRWHIPVRLSDLPDPFTGDLDGESIALDYSNHAEDALFILVHLFGHTAQWNTDPRAREIGHWPIRAGAYNETQLAAIGEYEVSACRLSLALLHTAGVHDLDQWLSDFAACDAAYLMHYYRTGEKRAFRSFWVSPAPLLTPMPIPDFTPRSWVGALSGRVI